MSYQEEQDDLIEKALKDDTLTEKVQEYLFNAFENYSQITKLIIGYVYCNNEENKELKRVGKFAGWRQATCAFQFLDKSSIPLTRSKNETARRYYDLYRKNWRSFRTDSFIKINWFWSEEKQDWVKTPQEAIKKGQKSLNTQIWNQYFGKQETQTAKEAISRIDRIIDGFKKK